MLDWSVLYTGSPTRRYLNISGREALSSSATHYKRSWRRKEGEGIEIL